MTSSFFNLPPKIPLTRKGNFSLLKNHELTYSTRSLVSVRFTLVVLVVLMISIAAASTVFLTSTKGLKIDDAQTVAQLICLWTFPLVIYAYFSWLYLLRSKYKITITEEGIIYERMTSSDYIPHEEIFTALESKPVLRNRVGVWLPTKGKMRILLSELDTLPGRPFIEELLAFYNMPMPRDPYGTDRNTFSALGLALLFIVCPFFIWSGYINENTRAMIYSTYIVIAIAIIGIILLLMSTHTTRSYRDDPEYDEEDDDNYDEYDDEEDERDEAETAGNGTPGKNADINPDLLK
jgi:hypothetical protein